MTPNEKFFFITGGTRGIGRAITLSQSRRGHFLFINYLRDDEAAQKLKRDAERQGARVLLVPGNIGDSDTVREIFQTIEAKTKRLDAVIHNAALGVFKPVTELRDKDWNISMDVNAKALLVTSQCALPLMKTHGGKIVAVSSIGAQRFTPHYGAIGISKAALENLVRYLAVELAPHRIRVNAVSGGLIETDSVRLFPEFDRMKKEFLARTPGRRIGKPEDLANVVSFLLSAESDWMFGQTLIADGGYSLI